VVVLGDSLTAGLGLSLKDAYPTRLQERINDDNLQYTIVNAGVSGDTSAGGLSRLDWALDGDVRVLILALGGNDGLRGLPPAELARNLSTIIERAQARGISVVLAGMEAPPNYGFHYVAEFHRVYPTLAKKYGLALVPFLLKGVGGVADLNQPDGIHPTAEGAEIVATNVWNVLKPVLEAESRRVGRGRVPGP
jgi:acyl-CoA thioesterase-1